MIARAAVLVVITTGAFVTIIALRSGGEPTFTPGETERAFDAASLEVEPTVSTFLKPVSGEDFTVVVFDTPEEAEWSYDFLRDQREEVSDVVGDSGLLLRRGNVLVHADTDVGDAARRKIERALARIAGQD